MVQLERASNYLRNENKADIDIEHSLNKFVPKLSFVMILRAMPGDYSHLI